MRKVGIFALLTALASLGANADSIVTSKTYVDAKVQAQGSTSGSILNSQSPDDKAPSAKAVYTALQEVSSASQNVQVNWDETVSSSDAYILNKPTITNAASDITGAVATDTKELPTTYAVQQYVTGVTSSINTVIGGLNTTYQAISSATDTYAVADGNGGWTNLGTTLDTTAQGYQATNGVTAATIKSYVDSAVSAVASSHTYTADETTVHLDSTNNQFSALTSAVASGATTLVTGADVYNALNDTTNNHSNFQTYSTTANQITDSSGGWKALDTQVNSTTAAGGGAPTTGAVKDYADAKVSSSSSISGVSTTTAPNEKAVYDSINAVQSAVTALQNCKHTCANTACTLIDVDCVDSYTASGE